MYNLEWLYQNPQHILLEVVSGSRAYGTTTPTSDKDIRGVFILPEEAILGLNYVAQINDDANDIVFYEIRRFLTLTAVNNPNILELLNTPKDCIIKKNPIFDIVLENKDKFVTKICGQSFGGYATQQISKARGLNKKQNWEEQKIQKKDILDFCYVPYAQGSIPVKEWLQNSGYEQNRCGLASIPHVRGGYHIFYDNYNQNLLYSGLIRNEESQDLCLSSIPKTQHPVATLFFNKDAYSVYCAEYKSYTTWLKERNVQRWTDVKNHGQKIDGKNMLHCKRLLEMAREIAEGKGVIVRRANADELLKIRRGEVPLQELLDWAEKEIKLIDALFQTSTLPDKVDPQFVHNLLVTIRSNFYTH